MRNAHIRRGGTALVALSAGLTFACATAQPSPGATPAPSGASSTSASSAPPSRPKVARVLPTLLLWPAGAPAAVGTAPADHPTITPYLPPAGTATGAAVLVFPGGGYGHLSMEKEGSEVAQWLASRGVTAFVVQYRLGPAYRHPTMLRDAQRAIRTVRSRAADWGVDPARLGILGFSAGGHLVSTAGTHFDAGSSGDVDPVQRVSSRPDFMVLIYPVITMRDSITHAGSRRNLIGEPPDSALQWQLSNETQVTRETPQSFIVASTDDRAVPVENSLLFYAALRRAAVPVELHVFEKGAHGFGLAPANPVLAQWLGLCEAWLRVRGLAR